MTDKSRKERFEFALGEYDKHKENLLKMLAFDLKKFFTEVEECELSNKISEKFIEVQQ